MPTTRDYYEILGVEKTADDDEVKRAYRRLAMKHHPDRNPGDAEAEAKFKEAAEAYEVLSDREKRSRYDQFGHAGVRGGGSAAHDFSRMNVDDIFSMFNDIFGGGGGGGPFAGGQPRGRRVARGYDLETEVEIDLSEVLAGTEADVEFRRLDVCDTCGGIGAKPGTEPVTCTTCGGQGKVAQQGLGGMFRMVTVCPTCGGTGKMIVEKCPACRGKGRLPKQRKLSVRIPAGIQDGQAVRVQGEGEPPPKEASPDGSGVRGDLHVVVRVAEHELFQREGDHLLLEMPISFTQATLGADVEVPTLSAASNGEAGGDRSSSGDGVAAAGRHTLTIPKGTQHGALFRIPGEGLPNLRSGRRGDLAVVAKIEIPTKLSGKQEELLRDFAETEDKDVLPESHGFFRKIRDFLGG